MSGSLVSPELRSRIRGIATPIATAMGRAGLTPNALTLIGFVISVGAGALAAAQLWLAAGLVVVFGGVFDLFDGALARATNAVSTLGAFLDSTFDRWSEGLVYVGIAWGAVRGGWTDGAVLAGLAMTSAFMVSYTRAKAESLGFSPGTGMANVGLAPREVRIAILTVGLVLTGIAGATTALAVALGAIAVLATITTLQRIAHTVRQARANVGR